MLCPTLSNIGENRNQGCSNSIVKGTVGSLLNSGTLVPPVSVESQKVFAFSQEFLSGPFKLLSLLLHQPDFLN